MKAITRTAPDGRTFKVYEGRCFHGACWRARCQCGVLLTSHDFDADGAIACALEALQSPAGPPMFGHVCA